MPKKPIETIAIALVAADAAIAVLESALNAKLTQPERNLITVAREKLAIAEGRVDDMRRLTSQLAEGI